MSSHETAGRVIRLRTNELQRTATALLVWAERARVELRGLDVRSASLEEAFLRIARDAAVQDGHRTEPAGAGMSAGPGRTGRTGRTRQTKGTAA